MLIAYPDGFLINWYQKLTQYLHVSDRANEPAWKSIDYEKLYKICPVLKLVWDSFAES